MAMKPLTFLLENYNFWERVDCERELCFGRFDRLPPQCKRTSHQWRIQGRYNVMDLKGKFAGGCDDERVDGVALWFL